MIRIVLPCTLLTTTLALTLPAHATLLTRTFVSSAGNDSNPCTITQPCATFAHAYSLTAPNGIVAALDPGKYGPLTITGPITINGNGWAAITAPAAGIGITVNAVSGNVALIGLNIDGAGAAYDGIAFNSGSSLTVTNCTVQNFVYDGSSTYTGNGIVIDPSSGTVDFAITNTTVANNGLVGIYYIPSGSPTTNGIIDHVVSTANLYGLDIFTAGASGGSAAITVSNSITSNNSDHGLYAFSGAVSLKLTLDNVGASGNLTGIEAGSTTKVLLSRSAVTANGLGIFNNTSPNTFYSLKDNRIGLNSTDVTGTLNNTTYLLQ